MRKYLLMAVGAVVACGAGAGSGGDDGVTTYLRSLPRWADFSPQRPSSEKLTASGTPSDQTVDGQKYSCKTNSYDLTANPDEIVIYQPDNNVLWPGALLQGKGYQGGIGSLKELPVRQRAPVTIFVNLLGNDVTETIDQPDAASLQSAIGRLVTKAKAQGVNPQFKASFNSTVYSNTTESSLKLGISAKFLATASVDSKLNLMRDSSMNAVMADLKASAFTVSVVAPQTPSAVFSKAFTKERLDEQVALGNIGPDNIPVYVSSITYGKRFLYNVVSKASTDDLTASLNASMKWAGLSAELESHYRSVLSQSQRGVVAIGGTEQQLRDAIDKGMEAYFGTDTPTDAWVPISYEMRNLGDGSIAKMSETTQYNLRECQAVGTKAHKVELQLVNVYSSASASAERDGQAATPLLNGEGDSPRIDISAYLTNPTDRIVIGNTADRTDWFNATHRHVTVNIWVDGQAVNPITSSCSYCHSEPRALVFTIDQATGSVKTL